MPIEAVKIPQNVYVEDRIIGPVTLRQIMIMMASAGVSYALWAVMRASGYTGTFYTTISWTPTLIGGLFAFVKINGIGMLRILLLSLERMRKPTTRRWAPHRGIYVNILTSVAIPERENPDIALKREKHQQTKVEELSHLLDKGPEEMQEAEGLVDAPIAEEKAAEPEDAPLPVNPSRIRAEERMSPASVDGISPAPVNDTQPSQGLMRDILPPMSHA